MGCTPSQAVGLMTSDRSYHLATTTIQVNGNSPVTIRAGIPFEYTNTADRDTERISRVVFHFNHSSAVAQPQDCSD